MAPAIVQVNVCWSLLAPSLAVTVVVNGPRSDAPLVIVPLITPVAVSIERPGGKPLAP